MKTMKKMIVILLAVVVTLGTLAGCAAPAAYSASESAGYYPAEPGQAYASEAPAESAEAAAEESYAFNGNTDPYPYQNTANTTNEEYGVSQESTFFSPLDQPLSTFSIDVDTASYSQIRQYLNDGWLPPTDAVRVEECINYFSYDYPAPHGTDPVNVGVTISSCPWNANHYLARVALKAAELDKSEAPPSNLVFLLDVSGSMEDPNKLPLVKSAMSMLADNLSEKDRVSIVVYAGASGVVLDGCPGNDKATINNALDRLYAGGSTAGGDGIELAYRVAAHYFIEGGNNRVILCTDGDFNVGPSSDEELESLIENKRDSGIFLSVLGFGTGNTKDNHMETLADKGNGNYGYIDSLMEAQKVLVKEACSTLFTVAKDVKVQVEFNPEAVREYRLVGYDNRVLAAEDFNNDRKDAGEMGAGHCVTAFYELVLVDATEAFSSVDPLMFQNGKQPEPKKPASDWMYVKFRYKQPESSESKLLSTMAGVANVTDAPDSDFVFASAVAEFALVLKDSQFKGNASLASAVSRAKASRGIDEDGYRAQFVQLAELAGTLYR